jgi:hypothetical protein
MPDEKRTRKSWQVPSYSATPSKDLHSWSVQQVDDGRAYFEASPGFRQLEESIRLLSGEPDPTLAAKQKDGKYSRLRTARLKRNLREMIGSLADIRFTPGYHSDNNDTQDQALTFNRVANAWYVDQFIDVKIKKAIQWMAISPCGWLEIDYRQFPGERNRQDIDVIDHSAFDVVMTGAPENGDHQEAYTVTLIKDLPAYLAHSLFPEKQDILQPDRETPVGWYEKLREKAKTVMADVFSVAGTSPQAATARNPTCRLYYQYILDLSVNRTGKEIKMGYAKEKIFDVATSKEVEKEIETPWSYKVPYVGQMIAAGYDGNGTPMYRAAQPKDCRMFPGRRLHIFNDQDTIRDGPSFSWHGKVPLVKLSADSWPFGDFSMVHDVAPIQETIGEIERMIHQTIRNRFNPSVLYDFKAVDRNKAKALRTDITGQRIGANLSERADPIRSLLPKEIYTVEDYVKWFLSEYLNGAEDYQMGVRDISAMAKMRAGASTDSMEKMMELAGPIVKSISRDMERSMRDLSDMFKYLVMQYYRTPKIMQIVGPNGVTPENIDFNPGNLIPSHLPGENKNHPSIYTEQIRAHWMADHVKFFITPNTMHEIVQTSQKLIYLQLWQKGFPISPWTLAEVLHIPNFGKKPDGANSELELWIAWQEMQLRMKMKMAAEAKILMKELGLDEGGEGGEGGGNTPGLGPKGGARGTGGRASTNAHEPQLKSKDGGTRSTIATSQ